MAYTKRNRHVVGHRTSKYQRRVHPECRGVIQWQASAWQASHWSLAEFSTDIDDGLAQVHSVHLHASFSFHLTSILLRSYAHLGLIRGTEPLMIIRSFSTGRMPFLSPNQQRQNTERNKVFHCRFDHVGQAINRLEKVWTLHKHSAALNYAHDASCNSSLAAKLS